MFIVKEKILKGENEIFQHVVEFEDMKEDHSESKDLYRYCRNDNDRQIVEEIKEKCDRYTFIRCLYLPRTLFLYYKYNFNGMVSIEENGQEIYRFNITTDNDYVKIDFNSNINN